MNNQPEIGDIVYFHKEININGEDVPSIRFGYIDEIYEEEENTIFLEHDEEPITVKYIKERTWMDIDSEDFFDDIIYYINDQRK